MVKTSNKKKKKESSNKDNILELIKIVMALIIGAILIKALFSAI